VNSIWVDLGGTETIGRKWIGDKRGERGLLVLFVVVTGLTIMRTIKLGSA